MSVLSDLGPAASGLPLRTDRANHLAGLRHFYPIPGPIPDSVNETEYFVQVRDGTEIRVLIYTPKKAPHVGSPLIAMFHEGGWCMGDLTDETLNCRMFCRDQGAVCVNVEYRLTPEHLIPTGVNDSWDVLKWCAKEALPASFILRADPKLGFIVGGASAGGNLAATLCQLGRDESLLTSSHWSISLRTCFTGSRSCAREVEGTVSQQDRSEIRPYSQTRGTRYPESHDASIEG
jgi:acetyl esterase/lipase